MFNFVQLIKSKNFSAIVKEYSITQGIEDYTLQDLANLKTKLINYNQSTQRLLRNLSDETISKTEAIIEIFQFFKTQRQTLIEISKESLRLALLNRENKTLYKELRQLRAETDLKLKTDRHFIRWASTILPEPSLHYIPHAISRNISQSVQSKAIEYVTPEEYDNSSAKDKEFVIRGEGVPLPLRLEREALDPKHRAWGTMYTPIRHALLPVHDTWVNSEKKEDLTVEIEFNDALRQKEQLFNSSMSQSIWDGLPSDDPHWFNSFNKYFTPIEVLDYLVTTNEQKQLCQNGIPLDTKGKSYIFAMDMQGNLFTSPDGSYRDGKRIGHPSFSQGQPVASAGELVIKNGKITSISNLSGHYQPGGHSLYRVVSELQKRGVLAEDCMIKVDRDDNFPYIKGGRSYKDFEILYRNSLGDAIVPQLELSEKPNPQRLLNSLTAINSYLSKRAGETSGFLTTFFNSYNGSDYYERRVHFIRLLDQMKEAKDIDSIVKLIDESLPHFSSGIRHHYANSLKELKAVLMEYKKYDSSVFNLGLVQETLGSYLALYNSMNTCTNAVKNYFHAQESLANESLAMIAAEKTDYKYLRKEVRSEIKTEFAKDDLLVEQEYNNIANFN